MKDLLKKDIDYKICILLAVLATALRLFIASQQMMYIVPGSAPIDDDLYFRMANSIASGNWLGEYNYLTLSKYPFFAVYLAGVHLSGIPYLVANAMFGIACAALCVWAFAPVIKKNIFRLAFYLVLIFNPSTMARHNLRVYRDTVYPFMCIMFMAALAGWALRAKKNIPVSALFLVLSGLALGMEYTTREDGYWILPYGVVAMLVVAVYILIDKKLDKKALRLGLMAVPYGICLCFVLIICSLNNKYYGLFSLSDFSDGSFSQCYGNMARLPHENWNPLVAVPKDVRELMYQECPSFAPFQQYLDDESSNIRKGFLKAALGDYQSGSFYWALRRAANELGYYKDARTAEAFWRQLSSEVGALCDKNEDSLKPRKGVTPPIKPYYVQPTIGEAWNSAVYIFSQKYFVAFSPSLSDPTTGQIDTWQAFLHDDSNYAAFEYTAIPYQTGMQDHVSQLADVIITVYRLLLAPFTIAGALLMIRAFARFKKIDEDRQILAFVVLGLLLMAVFRVFIISYMEVAAFNIGTYAMYLGPVYIMAVLVGALGLALI